MGLFAGFKAKKELKAEKKSHIAEIVKLRGRIYSLSYNSRVTDCITAAGAISADTVKEMLAMPLALLEGDLLDYSLDDICELKKQFELSLQLSQAKQDNTLNPQKWIESLGAVSYKNAGFQKLLLMPKEITRGVVFSKEINPKSFDVTPIRRTIEQYTKEYFGDERAAKIFRNLDDIGCFQADLDAPAKSCSVSATVQNTKVQLKYCLFHNQIDMLDPYNIDNVAHELYHNANSCFYFKPIISDIQYCKMGCKYIKFENNSLVYEFGNAIEECVAGAFGIYVSKRYCEQTGKTRSWNTYFGTTIAACVEQFALLKEQNPALYEEILDMAFEDDFELYLQKRDSLGIGLEAVGLTPRQQKIRRVFEAFDESDKLPYGSERNAELFRDISYSDI